uniref:Uncharacterized protein n=1 Tax=viral metagenome TaxID=1070528 RepID=A0A6H1ZNQ0_9ZZZZ
MRKDNRYVAELPSGYIKNPQLPLAGDDFCVNDVVYIVDNTVYPMFNDEKPMYGIVAARGVKGKPVLVAAI